MLSILCFFITAFIVDAGASIAGVSPDDGVIVVGTAVLAGAAMAAGATPPNRRRRRSREP